MLMGCDAYAMLDENAYECFMRLNACLRPRVLQVMYREDCNRSLVLCPGKDDLVFYWGSLRNLDTTKDVRPAPINLPVLLTRCGMQR